MTVLIALGASVLVFVLILLWVLIPALYRLPVVPSKPHRIRAAFRLADLRADETLYDLGAGDGRVLLIAASEFRANAVGIEVGPVQCVLIWLRVLAAGLDDRIQIRWGDFYKADLRAADVVYVYATSRELARLAPVLQAQLKPGSRVLSISADFPDWEPAGFDERELIFLYEMPPSQGNLTSYLLRKTTD